MSTEEIIQEAEAQEKAQEAPKKRGRGRPRKTPTSKADLKEGAATAKRGGNAKDESKRTPEQEERYQEVSRKLSAFGGPSSGSGAVMLVQTLAGYQERRARSLGLPEERTDGIPVCVRDFALSQSEEDRCAAAVELLMLELFPGASKIPPALVAGFVLVQTFGVREYTLRKLASTLAQVQEGHGE